MGAHNQRKKEGSNSNSSRTSPARLEDSEFVKNSLLATQSGDFDEESMHKHTLIFSRFPCDSSVNFYFCIIF